MCYVDVVEPSAWPSRLHMSLLAALHSCYPFCWRRVVLNQESGHSGGGFRLSSLRKSAIVAGLRGHQGLLRAVGDV